MVAVRGRCDGSEDVLSVARREAFEESGIAGLTPISNQPFDLDIHEIPAFARIYSMRRLT
jgi:8-oxo-dGTP pyrophosphatase MutT (NUDIX family)